MGVIQAELSPEDIKILGIEPKEPPEWKTYDETKENKTHRAGAEGEAFKETETPQNPHQRGEFPLGDLASKKRKTN